MENTVTITLGRAQVAEWRVAKAMASRDSGQSFTWGEFFAMLVGLYEQQPEPLAAQMAEDLRESDEESEVELIRDDALTMEVAAMTGAAANLTEETCELIAEKVAEIVVVRLKAEWEKS